jgi:hypothetical protein
MPLVGLRLTSNLRLRWGTIAPGVTEMAKRKTNFEYDVCPSFAGEDRRYVERVADRLRKNGTRVFYDKYEVVELWGKDLYCHLADIYQNAARYCVMFVSRQRLDRKSLPLRNSSRRSISPLISSGISATCIVETIFEIERRGAKGAVGPGMAGGSPRWSAKGLAELHWGS